ncbi:MAG: branched-chain amino acid ABC transporter permease [Desulfocucumaceae bacterium]
MIIDLLIFGVIWASIYTLIALGFSLIFGVARVMNLAHGAFFMVASYMVFFLATNRGLNMIWAIIAAIVITILLALLSYRILIRPMKESLTRILMVTMGLAMFLEQVMLHWFGPDPRYVPTTIPGSVSVLGVRVTNQQFLAIMVSIFLIIAMWYLLTKTKAGRIIRAVAADREMATLIGIDEEKTYYACMGLSALLAAVAGVLVAPFLTVTPTMGWSPILAAFTIVVLGGMGSVWGTVLGALIVAYAEVITAYAISPQLKEAVTFSIMILALIFRPHGLFGKGVGE